VAGHCWQLESPRLSLQPLAPADRDELLALFNHPGVRRYLLDDKLVWIEWVDEAIRKSLRLFASAGCGLWAARRKGVADIIGFAGYGFLYEPPELQLLYGLHPGGWGRGLATEAARAVVAHAFHDLGFDEIIASADAPNEASIRVMQRLGMRFNRRVAKCGRDTIYNRLARPSPLCSRAVSKNRLNCSLGGSFGTLRLGIWISA
jgi:ribosomal-protein-alanine N-acetyltransferase